MDANQLLGLLSRWLHIIPVIILVGGTIFMRLALVPATQSGNSSDELREQIRKRWAKWIGISILLLLVTGLYNAVAKIMAYELPSLYHTLVVVKLAIGLVIFFLASLLSGRSAKAQKLRENEIKWLNILCVLMLVLVIVAGYMKYLATDCPKKERVESSASTILESKFL